MVINDILGRADLKKIIEFLIYGCELSKTDPRNLEQRTNDAEKQICDWLTKQFPDYRSQDKAIEAVLWPLDECEECYMELGLQIGMLLIAQCIKPFSDNPSSWHR